MLVSKQQLLKMDLLALILHNFFSFIFIISLIVFIHEFGHFYVARLCGVKVDQFAIGFGKELFGFNDKHGTRWKFCLVPMGGYVKMFGDRNAASIADDELIAKMSEEEKQQSFIAKNAYQRMAIVAAGPIANFILAIVIFTFMFNVRGESRLLPVIHEVLQESAAFDAGLKKGDDILWIGDKKIETFSDLAGIIAQSKEGDVLPFKVKREGEILVFDVKPKMQVRKDVFGEEVKIPTVGVSASEIVNNDLNIVQSFVKANQETYNISVAIFSAIGDLITGDRSVKELGGPIKIAKYSGKTVSAGFWMVIWFMAMISINLGVMNLLPVPVLDGGHLFYYIIELIKGKPLSKNLQDLGYRAGFALLMTLMLFTTFNDLVGLFN
ncbi:MAG: RIP metalloprotease RseP [Rickettsiales bacterium]|nr:RIP metalloprotease RseP [Rickettsiales bacterium]